VLIIAFSVLDRTLFPLQRVYNCVGFFVRQVSTRPFPQILNSTCYHFARGGPTDEWRLDLEQIWGNSSHWGIWAATHLTQYQPKSLI
jgi:hypothetical protein